MEKNNNSSPKSYWKKKELWMFKWRKKFLTFCKKILVINILKINLQKRNWGYKLRDGLRGEPVTSVLEEQQMLPVVSARDLLVGLLVKPLLKVRAERLYDDEVADDQAENHGIVL